MKNVIRSFTGFFAVLAASSVIAQNSIQVKVPFAFSAAQQTFPAGDYRITLLRESSLVTVCGDNAVATFFATPGVDVQDRRSFLRFKRFGNDWVLNAVAFSGSTQQLSAAKAEKRFTVRQDPADQKAMAEVPMPSFDSQPNRGREEN